MGKYFVWGDTSHVSPYDKSFERIKGKPMTSKLKCPDHIADVSKMVEHKE